MSSYEKKAELSCHVGILWWHVTIACCAFCCVSCSIGLKTVIEAASGNLAPPLAALVSSRMAAGVQQKVTLHQTLRRSCCESNACLPATLPYGTAVGNVSCVYIYILLLVALTCRSWLPCIHVLPFMACRSPQTCCRTAWIFWWRCWGALGT